MTVPDLLLRIPRALSISPGEEMSSCMYFKEDTVVNVDGDKNKNNNDGGNETLLSSILFRLTAQGRWVRR